MVGSLSGGGGGFLGAISLSGAGFGSLRGGCCGGEGRAVVRGWFMVGGGVRLCLVGRGRGRASGPRVGARAATRWPRACRLSLGGRGCGPRGGAWLTRRRRVGLSCAFGHGWQWGVDRRGGAAAPISLGRRRVRTRRGGAPSCRGATGTRSGRPPRGAPRGCPVSPCGRRR